ncbi:MAG: hypothetical protein HKN81_02675 [Gammaproteobacteria bacterium]|nr:hypothetical protein [Gammaproteobacteria bacterium]
MAKRQKAAAAKTSANETGWILLISGGSRISEPHGADKLDYVGFLGIRYETGG